MASATQRKNITLVLGGFTVMVDVESALDASNKPVSLNNLCVGAPGGEPHGPAQTRQTLACPVCKNDDRDAFAHGKDMGAGAFVVVPDEVLADAGAANATISTAIELKAHPRDQIDRLLNGEKCYFLVPSNAAQAQGYALIASALAARPNLAFLATWAVRSAQAMYEVVTIEGRLAIKQLAWPGAVRALPVVPDQFDTKFLSIALDLIDATVSDYVAGEYVDGKSKIILDYLDNAQVVTGAEVPDAGGVTMPTVDLESSLLASLAAATAGKAPVQPMPSEMPGNVERIAAPRKTARKAAAPRKRAAAKVG